MLFCFYILILETNLKEPEKLQDFNMKRACKIFILLFIINQTLISQCFSESVIRINQLGYLPDAIKQAVFLSDEKIQINSFELFNSTTDKKVFEGKAIPVNAKIWGKQTAYRLDFSDFHNEGGFYIVAASVHSESLRISNDIYEGVADFILN